MRSVPTRKKRSRADSKPGANVDTNPKREQGSVDGLLQRLIDQVETEKPTEIAAAHTDRQNVMLDVQVDGVRCVLTRVPTVPVQPHVMLSPREREIARMVASGHPNKTIAGVLEISSWTVSTYLRRIFAKLNVNSRAAMVARLMTDGLLAKS